MDTLFAGISTGAIISGDEDDPQIATDDGPDGVVAGSDGDPLLEGDLPEDVNTLLIDLVDLHRGAARALAKDPADWAEFGKIQDRIQDLLEVLEGSLTAE